MISANNAAATKPVLRYNDTTKRWQFSNDGVNFINMLGASGSAFLSTNVPGNSTVDVADFTIPAGLTLFTRVLGSLMAPAADKVVKIRNITDGVDVLSTTSAWDTTFTTVPSGNM